MTEKRREEEEEEKKSRNQRILVRYLIFVVLFLCPVIVGIITVTLKTSFKEKEKWMKVAEQQKKPNREVYPNRGNIFSADGQLMATNIAIYDTYIDFRANGFPEDSFLYSKNNGIDSLAYCLSKMLKNRTPEGYKKHLMRGLKAKSRQYRVYEGRVSYIQLKEIKQFPFFRYGRNVSGFYEKEMVERQKFFERLASRTIGDIHKELDTGGISKGRIGLERYYNTRLCGKPGLKAIMRVGGQWTNVIVEEPVNGMDLHTTIDIPIQDFTDKALAQQLKAVDAEKGIAVVMEVKTGEIKAISNLTRVRPGEYGETMNYAVSDGNDPGSTFKIASMMVALEDGVCTPNDRINTEDGTFRYGGKIIRDHNAHHGGYQTITAAQSIWYSSNIGIAKIILKGYEKNPQKFIDGLHKTGIATNFDLEIDGKGEAKIRQPGDRYWSKLSLPWISFGYEVKMPPINMLAFFNAIANDGQLMRPMFVKEITKDGEVVQSFKPQIVNPAICSPETLHDIQDMLYQVVNYRDPLKKHNGTGGSARSSVVKIAGKTATAQIGASRSSHNLSFCGYFPYEAPQYSCIVTITNPRKGIISGGLMAGPVFKEIAEKIYASQQKIDVATMSSDSIKGKIPPVKNGFSNTTKEVLEQLKVSGQQLPEESELLLFDRNNHLTLTAKELKTAKGAIPSVIGMGAKDAVYLLEQNGLVVQLAGRGSVVSQSLPAGERIVKGKTIKIVLSN